MLWARGQKGQSRVTYMCACGSSLIYDSNSWVEAVIVARCGLWFDESVDKQSVVQGGSFQVDLYICTCTAAGGQSASIPHSSLAVQHVLLPPPGWLRPYKISYWILIPARPNFYRLPL